jgi:hypothetical protein
MKQTLLTLALAMSLGFAGAAAGADPTGMSKADHQAQKDRIEADYKTAKDQCDSLIANAKDVCQAEAKGKRDVAKAELEARYEPSPRHDADVAKEKADADYSVAKQRCDDQSGSAKSACEKEAKAAYEKAKGESKAVKLSEQADETKASGAAPALGSGMNSDAQYTAAKARCDAMSGAAARNDCLNDAKKKFGKM